MHNAAFVNVKHNFTLVGDIHEVVQATIVLFDVIFMDAEIISDFNDTCALFQDLVNLYSEISFGCRLVGRL